MFSVMLSLTIRSLQNIAVTSARKFVHVLASAGYSTARMLKQTCTVETSVTLFISIIFALSCSKFFLLQAFSSFTGNTSFALAVNLCKFSDLIVHHCGTVLVGCLGVLRNSGAISKHTDVLMLLLVASVLYLLPKWWENSASDEVLQTYFGVGVSVFQTLFSDNGGMWNITHTVVRCLVLSANCLIKTTSMFIYTATCAYVPCEVRPETSDFMIVFGLALTWNSRVTTPLFYALRHLAMRY